ncbi:MAG: fructosamine kinase family protein [Psychroflexus sp.]|nr:fructosamine kinase family protein [Psychroflexus sp.]MDN6309874.1 fructosamine kinase family protein [Psychroflexus sp.]
MRELLSKIALDAKIQLRSAQQIRGGDINTTYLLKTDSEKFVVKINHKHRFPEMLKREAKGLERLRETQTFFIPEVFKIGEYNQFQYLILDYINSHQPQSSDFSRFGEQLAQLHQHTETSFGLVEDNYIGKLKQGNTTETSAVDFLINQRLLPQLKLALQNKYDLKQVETFLKQVEQLIPDQKSSLTHGDLWTGNYLYSKDKDFCLIDPAVAYSLKNFDIAMMKLFGGFSAEAFERYYAIHPKAEKEQNHLDIYQLYYLLVHLNCFGQSYFSRCQNIISKYT